MEITPKILRKLLAKKYRQEFSLCILEGEKIIQDHMDLVVKIFPEDSLKNLEHYHGRVAVARIPQPTAPTTPFLVLDRIQDPGNLGTLLRTALAFNFKTIYTIDCVDPYSPKVIRASSGMVLRLNVIDTDYEHLPVNTLYYIADLHGKPPTPIKHPNFGIVLGNEGQGINPIFYQKPHQVVTIPMTAGCESLNVAVAGGIIMCYTHFYEWT
ncbi:MAG: RNA methyltransferase [Prevotella sp.]|nr:RNA methyltransferase [Prevotella sp.]